MLRYREEVLRAASASVPSELGSGVVQEPMGTESGVLQPSLVPPGSTGNAAVPASDVPVPAEEDMVDVDPGNAGRPQAEGEAEAKRGRHKEEPKQDK